MNGLRRRAYLFQDAYEWVGTLRDYDIRKGVTLFELGEEVESAADQIFTKFHEADFLRALDVEEFSGSLAHLV